MVKEYRTLDTKELAPYPGMTSEDLQEFETWAAEREFKPGFWPAPASRGTVKATLLVLAGAVLAGVFLGLLSSAQGAEAPLTRAEPIVRMVLQEASSEPYAGMVAVAAVALDRMGDRRWPSTAAEVVYQPVQFSAMSLKMRDYSVRVIRQARAAVAHARTGWRPCGPGVFWYYAAWSKPPYWTKDYTFKCAIGDHLFYVDKETN